MKLLLIHGRSQQGRSAVALKKEWLGALEKGLAKSGLKLPAGVEIAVPFFGDRLDELSRADALPLAEGIAARGEQVDRAYLDFRGEVLDAMRLGAGISDEEVEKDFGSDPTPRDVQNWRWVGAIVRAIDRNVPGVSGRFLDEFLRDVYLYANHRGVSSEINDIVVASLDETPTVIVSHSLGTVVAYAILRSDPRRLRVPLLVTLGSPLAIRPIRDQFRPLRPLKSVQAWFNAYDRQDIVALHPLDHDNFPAKPRVLNHPIRNATSNHHGIGGYLDDAEVANRIQAALR